MQRKVGSGTFDENRVGEENESGSDTTVPTRDEVHNFRHGHLALLVRAKVDISTPVDKSSSNRRHTSSETELQYIETLVIRTFLDVPDIDLVWYIRCSGQPHHTT
jgi:hypothetical protein